MFDKFNLVRWLNKSGDVSEQQRVISSAISNLAETLPPIAKGLEEWPTQPTGDDTTDSRKININLVDFTKAFRNFAKIFAPSESEAVYRKLLDLRAKAKESRKKLADLKKDRKTIGPRPVLAEAQRLRGILQEQRAMENAFVVVLLHEWRAAVSLLASDLRECDTINKRNPNEWDVNLNWVSNMIFHSAIVFRVEFFKIRRWNKTRIDSFTRKQTSIHNTTSYASIA